MKNSARQWTFVIRILDGLCIALIIYLAWVTYSTYRIVGGFRSPVSLGGIFCLAFLLVIRGIATRERKKTEEVERASHAK
jgi:hypothetical protein